LIFVDCGLEEITELNYQDSGLSSRLRNFPWQSAVDRCANHATAFTSDSAEREAARIIEVHSNTTSVLHCFFARKSSTKIALEAYPELLAVSFCMILSMQ